jgi:hypothetical protein
MPTIAFLAFAVLVLASAVEAQETVPPVALARVDLAGVAPAYALPAHALLQDANGQDYLLVFATETALAAARQLWRVIEARATAPGDYLLARPVRAGAREALQVRFNILADDGRQLLLRATAAEAEDLAGLGCLVQRLSSEPLRWSLPHGRSPKDGEPWSPQFSSPPDARVAAALEQVSSTNLYWLLRRFTGEEPLLATNGPRLIQYRQTPSKPQIWALQFVAERFSALGRDTQYQTWWLNLVNPLWSGFNIVATQRGGALSNEVVLITAHLDDLSQDGYAPGADDNASGCAAVLTAAGLLRQFNFERTIRYVLFTGEEDGLYGSTYYAGQAVTNGENIVAVLNLDMIGWDTSNTPPTLNLHIRSTASPGFSNDLAIVTLFTNCVGTYGVSQQLAPRILTDNTGYSDHEPFWNRGFSAALVIEDDYGDFNPYYHTRNDTVARLNWTYLTAAVRAAIATTAHMARPTGVVRGGVLELADSDWLGERASHPGSGSSTGVGAFRAAWGRQATVGLDPLDVLWTNLPAPPQARWLRVASTVAGAALQTEAQPDNGDVRFHIQLSAVVTNGTTFSSTNRLRFELLTGDEPDRTYTARVELDPAFTDALGGFLCFTNLREALVQGGFVSFPALTNLTNGATYGTCEFAIRALATNRTDCPAQLVADSGGLSLVTRAQIGTFIADEVQTATTPNAAVWQPVGTFTNRVAPDAVNFDSGWQELTYDLGLHVAPAEGSRYYRLRRTWLPQ